MHSEPTVGREPARWRWLGSLLLLAGCGTLIGVEDSRVQGACESSAECAPGYGCLLGACRNDCAADQDCGPGLRCLKAIATSACIPATEGCGQGCPDGTSCAGEVCRTTCTDSSECATGQQCEQGSCVGQHETSGGSGAGASGGSGGSSPGGNGGAALGGSASGDSGDSGTAGAGGSSTGGQGGDESVGGSSGDEAIHAAGERCFVVGEGACAGHAQRDRVVCDGSRWVVTDSCSNGSNCDTTVGEDAGACRTILAECAGKPAGTQFCSDGSVAACGKDLVTVDAGEHCDDACLAGSCVDCIPQEKRCSDGFAQTCQAAGAWNTGTPCEAVCQAGSCKEPPSCSSVGSCAGATSCCRSELVPGGSFSRNYDGVTAGFEDPSHKATLSAFQLDRYEVTVSRFRNFVNAYPSSKPSAGAGKNPHVAADPGWQAAYTLPASASALKQELACTDGTWTDIAGANEGRPINCVSWYLAYAFCIWDGGRLPTDAEWNLAAAGGDQQRVYPWSSPATSKAIAATQAVYEHASGLPSLPGSVSPSGDSRWEQADLAGNVNEWVLDWYFAGLPTSCDDCAALTASASRVLRGGSYSQNANQLITSYRLQAPPDYLDQTTGIRCARNE